MRATARRCRAAVLIGLLFQAAASAHLCLRSQPQPWCGGSVLPELGRCA